MGPWRQSPELCSHRPRRSRSYQKLEEERKDRCLALWSQHGPADALISGLQDPEKARFHISIVLASR